MNRLTKIGATLLSSGALLLPGAAIAPAHAANPTTPCTVEVVDRETVRFAFTCDTPTSGMSYFFSIASTYGGDWVSGGNHVASASVDSNTPATNATATDNGDGTTTYVTNAASDLAKSVDIGREPQASQELGEPWLYASAVRIESGANWEPVDYLNRTSGTAANAYDEFFETTTSYSLVPVEPNSRVHIKAFDALGVDYFAEFDTQVGPDGLLRVDFPVTVDRGGVMQVSVDAPDGTKYTSGIWLPLVKAQHAVTIDRTKDAEAVRVKLPRTAITRAQDTNIANNPAYAGTVEFQHFACVPGAGSLFDAATGDFAPGCVQHTPDASGELVIPVTPANQGTLVDVFSYDQRQGVNPQLGPSEDLLRDRGYQLVGFELPDLFAPAAPVVAYSNGFLSGTGEADARVNVNVDGKAFTGVVGTDGTFSINVGAWTKKETFSVTLTDAADNTSDPGIALGTLAVDGLTATPGAGGVVTGKTDPGAQVTVAVTDRIAGDRTFGPVTASTDGTYTVPTDALKGQLLVVTSTLTSGADAATATASITALVQPPAIENLSLNGNTVTGTTDPRADVTIHVRTPTGDTNTLTGKADATGGFSIVSAQDLTHGQTTQVNVTDPYGYAASATGPTAPSVASTITAALDEDGSSITGTGEPGTIVSAGTLGSATVRTDGTYTLTLTSPLEAGKTVSVLGTDIYGVPTNTVNLTQKAAPAPTTPDLTATFDAYNPATISGTIQDAVGVKVRVTDEGLTVLEDEAVVLGNAWSYAFATLPTPGQVVNAYSYDASGIESRILSFTVKAKATTQTPDESETNPKDTGSEQKEDETTSAGDKAKAEDESTSNPDKGSTNHQGDDATRESASKKDELANTGTNPTPLLLGGSLIAAGALILGLGRRNTRRTP